jgi:hypothetical protein
LPATEPGGNPFYDLTRAHVVVDASDYHVIELSAAGVAMGEPVAIGFRLLERSVWQTAPSTADFRLPLEGSHSIVLTGAGSKAPPQDLFAALLTELSRLNP